MAFCLLKQLFTETIVQPVLNGLNPGLVLPAERFRKVRPVLQLLKVVYDNILTIWLSTWLKLLLLHSVRHNNSGRLYLKMR